MSNPYARGLKRLPPQNYFMNWLRKQLTEKQVQSWFKMTFHYSDGKRETIKNGKKSEEKQYVSDVISADEIKNNWRPETPIFISAQTGSGKNYFIRNVLIENIVERTHKPENRILVLSNRIALNRQNKYHFAEHTVRTGNSSYSHLYQYYLPKGIDNFCKEFGNVDVYSYHQLYEEHILDIKQYKYIVCDECHFFTSDSRFNPETNEILKEIVAKGQDSVRIYLSATPEVAFEAIIRQEFDYTDNFRNELRKAVANDFKNCGHTRIMTALASNRDVYTMEVLDTQVHQARLKQALSEITLHVHFYYMRRDYTYLNLKIYEYAESLISDVVSTASKENKWILFVSSKKMGKEIKARLKEVNKDCIFISSENKDFEGSEQASFDFIAKEETFTQEILICTSVLDNGINIKDKDVHNIALFNVYERTEFIQMIGRLRIADSVENTEINLHVTLPTIDSVKKQMRRDVKNLIYRLAIDGMTIPERKKYCANINTTDIPHDKHMFRFPEPDNDNVFCEYNPCAIYQLVDSLTCMMRIIRKNEPEYCIEPDSTDLVATQVALVKSYIDTIVDEKDWSRSVIDLLGLKEEIERRKELYEEDKKKYDFWENYYQYNFDDTFLNYLFGTLIPESLTNAWQEGFEKCIRGLDAQMQDYIHTLLKKAAEKKSLSFVKRIDTVRNDSIYKSLPNDCQNTLDFYRKEASKVDKEIKHYNQLLENTGIPIVEQLKWIERNIGWIEDDAKKQADDKKGYEFIRGTCCAIALKESKTYEEFIVRIAVTPDMLEQAKKADKVYDKQFLLQHGVPINTKELTSEEIEISTKFLGGAKFQGTSGELNKIHDINGETYLVISCQDNTSEHSIYYVYVKQSSPTKKN